MFIVISESPYNKMLDVYGMTTDSSYLGNSVNRNLTKRMLIVNTNVKKKSRMASDFKTKRPCSV